MKKSIKETHPHLVKEWSKNNSTKPEEVSAGSGRIIQWECSENPIHLWDSTIKNRTKGSGCPYCAGKKVLEGVNDVSTTHPHLVKEWSSSNTVSYNEVSSGSNKKIVWECSNNNNHQWKATIYSRCVLNSGCPYCANQKAEAGVNDLATTHPHLVKEWSKNNSTKPEEVSAGSNKRVEWQCKNNSKHVWEAVIASRRNQVSGSGCPYCANQKAEAGVNDLATTHPHLVKEWDDDREITTVSAGSDYVAQWKCEEGHQWQCSVYNRTRLKRICDICSCRKLLVGFNDLATTHPHLVKEWSKNNTIKPEEVIAGSHKKVEWQCSKDSQHMWTTMIGNRTKSVLPTQCPHCYAKTFVSEPEKEIYHYIKTLFNSSSDSIEIKQSVRGVIRNQELDIYLPEFNFAIEYNGLYWHSESAGKNKYYHFKKHISYKNKGIKLFQIWEDDYLNNKELIQKMIAHQLGCNNMKPVYARKTSFVQVKKNQAEDFLSLYHLQGMNHASSYFGLKDDDENLVAIMGVQKKKDALEISRFATSGRVTGAFSKLMKNVLVLKQYSNLKTLISYSHNDHSWGQVYAKNGFTKVHDGTPGYFYFRNDVMKREFRRNYTINEFKRKPSLIYKDGYSEAELADINNLHRIWDAGSAKWVKELV